MRQTALVVDDDPLVLTNTVALLNDLGYGVIRAASAAEALNALTRQPEIAVVVTDLAMPETTGASLYALVRAVRPHLPFVVMSGCADFPGDLDARVVKLAKPFTQEQLAGAVWASLAGV